MSDAASQNGWNEYSKLVLKELEVLAAGINSLKREIQDLKQEMTELRLREDKIKELEKHLEELREWVKK